MLTNLPKKGYRVLTLKDEILKLIVERADEKGTTPQEYIRALVIQDSKKSE